MLERPQSNDEQDRATTATHATSRITVPQDDVEIKAKPVSQDVLKMVSDVAQEVIGAKLDTNAPLMSAGLDSISATEFTSELAARFNMDLAPTILFDHPTLDALADFISSELASNAATDDIPRGGAIGSCRGTSPRDERRAHYHHWRLGLHARWRNHHSIRVAFPINARTCREHECPTRAMGNSDARCQTVCGVWVVHVC